MSETLFVFSNDDAGMQEPECFAELLAFLAEQQVPATFFTVPYAGGVSLEQKPEWVRLIGQALQAGHEVQHHGWVHTAFEFGVPPPFMLDIMPESKAQWLANPLDFSVHHEYEILCDKLLLGRQIFRRLLGYEPIGFRSPCLAVCDNLYRALHDLGFQWSSDQVINPMGWRYINHDYDAGEPWQPEVAPFPYLHRSGVIEVPMHSEYSWYLTDDDVERHFQLAKNDFDRARQAGNAFVVLSHYFAMTGQWSAGLRVYERLFHYARSQANVRFVTMSELVRITSAGV